MVRSPSNYTILNNGYLKWIILAFITILWIGLGFYFSDLSLFKQILMISISVLAVFLLALGLRPLLFFLLPISIVSRGVFNLIGFFTIWDGILFLISGYIIINSLNKKRNYHVFNEGTLFIILLIIIFITEVMGLILFPDIFYQASFKPFMNFFEGILLIICVVTIIKNIKDIKIITYLFIFTGLLFSLIIIYESHFGLFYFGIQPVFSNAYLEYRGSLRAHTGSLLLLLPAFWFAFFLRKRNPLFYLIMPVMLFAFALSSTRSLYLGFLGGIVSLFYLRYLSDIFLIVTVAGSVAWFVSDFLIPRVSEITNSMLTYFGGKYSTGMTSTIGRLIIAKTAISNFLTHPLWGFGINGFGMETYADPQYLKKFEVHREFDWFFRSIDNPEGNTHNQYLQILVDHGLIALVIFLALSLKLVKISYRNIMNTQDLFIKDVSKALFVSLVGYLFVFMGAPLLTSMANILSMTSFGFCVGLIYSIKGMITSERGDIRQIKMK